MAGHVTSITSITKAKTAPICGTNAEKQAGQGETCELGSPPAASHPFGEDFQGASECVLEVRGPPVREALRKEERGVTLST